MSRWRSGQEALDQESLPAGQVHGPSVHSNNSNVTHLHGSGKVTNNNNQFVSYVDARPPERPATYSR